MEDVKQKLHRDCEPYYFEGSKRARIEAELQKILVKGIIEESRSEPLPIFTRDKKDGGLRIILDL